MPAEELVRACVNELRGSDDLGTAPDITEANRVALLVTRGVASGLVSGAVDGEDGDWECSLKLFEALIGEARRDEERSGRIGGVLLEEAVTSIEALVVLDGLGPPATHDLANAYDRAGAESPAALVQRLIWQIGPLTEAGRLPFDRDTEIERLRPVLEAGEYFPHRKLNERVGVMPEQARVAFSYEVECRAEAVCGRIGMYWLLDPSSGVRLRAAEGFHERSEKKIVEPALAALVPLIRNWMPADAARTILDEALRETPRGGRFARLPSPARHRAESLGRIPNRWGAQMLHAVLQGGDQPAVATVATESARGVSHAFVTPGVEALSVVAAPDAGNAMMAIPWEAFEFQSAAALAEGLVLERPPPSGLVALAWGMCDERPRAMTVQDWLTEVDSDGEIVGLAPAERGALVQESTVCPGRHFAVRGWVEGTALLHEAMEEGVREGEVKAAVRISLDTRRDDWALLILRGAHVLKGIEYGDRRSCMAPAMTLLNGRPVETIPIMELIRGATHEAQLNEGLAGALQAMTVQREAHVCIGSKIGHSALVGSIWPEI